MAGRERDREAETQAEGEAGSMHREPDAGLDPGTPGSRPGPKADAQPLSHLGVPMLSMFKMPKGKDHYWHFCTQASRSYITCANSQSLSVAQPGFEPRALRLRCIRHMAVDTASRL